MFVMAVLSAVAGIQVATPAITEGTHVAIDT